MDKWIRQPPVRIILVILVVRRRARLCVEGCLGRHKLILKYFLKYFKLNKTNPQMGDNVLHARLVTIHHCFSAVFKKELNIRRCRLIAIRRDDHVLILEA